MSVGTWAPATPALLSVPVPPPQRGPGTPAIAAVDLVREFTRKKKPPVRALRRLSLTVAQGEVHGLLGPNGAGKTTFVKILSTILLPTTGQAAVCGYDVVRDSHQVRRLIGVVMGGERGLYTRLTARQNLEFWGAVQKVPHKVLRSRTEELLHRLGLAAKADARVETYSRGMKQRLHLARGLIGDARVLFLDEPTMGMDPVAAREFRKLIGELRDEQRTILLATHDMAEAESLCDRVSFVRDGTVVATRSPQAVAELVSAAQGIELGGVDAALASTLAEVPGVTSVTADGPTVRVLVRSQDDFPRLLHLLADHGVTSLRTLRPSLEDVYVRLIGDRGLEV
ncbi:ABC transporter ATP-binding protein (plasmid) [Streptomyces sp. NBC_01216]|uniref:ABC transporter ATP-binding protein n=1 Tax=Streptomyces sp. NBC_01216 TaxID=2903778 RepID=UPI002E12831A|nr:ABC transporter ATP-binding protein [Streptomyces sp. NBC_01216]